MLTSGLLMGGIYSKHYSKISQSLADISMEKNTQPTSTANKE